MDHSRIFLPNLVRLHWVCSLNGDKSVNCIPLLGGQRLEDLTISGDSVPPSSNHAIEAMIHTLSLIPQSSPNLRRFTIKLFYQLAWNIIAGPVSSLLQSLPRLEELDSCFAFMDDAYAHLAHLPTLKIFRGMIPPLRNHPVLVTPSDAPIFPSLTELDLDAMELGSCITLVSCMGSTALEKLCSATNVPGLVTAADVKDLFVALRRQSSLKKLSIIRRKFSSEANIAIHEGPEHTLFSHDIFPLLELQNLTELVIDIDAPFDIDDDCLRAMAEAWPKLQVLSAYSPAPIGRRSKTTLRGLLFLAEHCPLLKKLDINLDTHLVDDDIREASKNLRPRKHNLQNLNVYFWSSLGNPAQVAEFLIGLFPEVTVNANPVCERDGNEKMIIEWGAFQAFLKGFARKDADAGRW